MATMKEAAEKLRQSVRSAEEGKEVNKVKETEMKQETPAEPPENKETELGEQLVALSEENERLRKELEDMGKLLREMSEQNHAETVMEMTEPTIDWERLMTGGPESAEAQMAEYEEAVRTAARAEAEQELKERLEPVLAELHAREQAMCREQMLRDMKASPAMPGFGEMLPRVDAFVKNNAALYGGVSPEEAYINAYLAQKGYDAIHSPDTPSEDAMFLYYEENPGFQKRIEEARLARMKAGNAVVPFAPSEGAGGAALSLPKKPKTFEEAKRMAASKRV